MENAVAEPAGSSCGPRAATTKLSPSIEKEASPCRPSLFTSVVMVSICYDAAATSQTSVCSATRSSNCCRIRGSGFPRNRAAILTAIRSGGDGTWTLPDSAKPSRRHCRNFHGVRITGETTGEDRSTASVGRPLALQAADPIERHVQSVSSKSVRRKRCLRYIDSASKRC